MLVYQCVRRWLCCCCYDARGSHGTNYGDMCGDVVTCMTIMVGRLVSGGLESWVWLYGSAVACTLNVE